MDMLSLLSNALSAGSGAFAGALAAYFLACRKEREHARAEYLSLLLMIYEQIGSIYILLQDIPPQAVKEVEGKKFVVFDMPFPEFVLTPQQLQMLFKIAPDKQMPSALFQFQQFLKGKSRRIVKEGVTLTPLDDVQRQAEQLKFMRLSLRVQYEQETNDAFPLE